MSNRRTVGVPGIGVDAFGGSVLDPTQNVIALNDAANRRQDDLREMHNRLTNAEIMRLEQAVSHVAEVARLRAEHAREIGHLHQEHDREIHRAEQGRLDSIRQIDVSAAKTESERNQMATQALASQAATTAETLRAAVASTQHTTAATNAATAAALSDRISALEKSSYEGKGKQSFADPMVEELVREVKALRESRSEVRGKSAGISVAWAALLGLVTMIAGLLAIGGVLYAVLKP